MGPLVVLHLRVHETPTETPTFKNAPKQDPLARSLSRVARRAGRSHCLPKNPSRFASRGPTGREMGRGRSVDRAAVARRWEEVAAFSGRKHRWIGGEDRSTPIQQRFGFIAAGWSKKEREKTNKLDQGHLDLLKTPEKKYTILSMKRIHP